MPAVISSLPRSYKVKEAAIKVSLPRRLLSPQRRKAAAKKTVIKKATEAAKPTKKAAKSPAKKPVV